MPKVILNANSVTAESRERYPRRRATCAKRSCRPSQPSRDRMIGMSKRAGHSQICNAAHPFWVVRFSGPDAVPEATADPHQRGRRRQPGPVTGVSEPRRSRAPARTSVCHPPLGDDRRTAPADLTGWYPAPHARSTPRRRLGPAHPTEPAAPAGVHDQAPNAPPGHHARAPCPTRRSNNGWCRPATLAPPPQWRPAQHSSPQPPAAPPQAPRRAHTLRSQSASSHPHLCPPGALSRPAAGTDKGGSSK